MSWEDIKQLAIDSYPCSYCGAAAGQRCRARRSGAPARYMHAGRTWSIQEAWGIGYREAEVDVFDSALDNPDWFARRLERHRDTRKQVAQ